MPRSKEAIRRRAEKRNKSVAEQRRADLVDALKCKERQTAKETKARGAPATSSTLISGSAPPTASASNPTKRTVTPPRKKAKKSAKHKIKRGPGEQAPTPKWAQQATQEQIDRNASLRKQYLENKGEGMSKDDVQRARTLIERDERKRAKKAERAKKKLEKASQKDESSSTKGKQKRQNTKENPELASTDVSVSDAVSPKNQQNDQPPEPPKQNTKEKPGPAVDTKALTEVQSSSWQPRPKKPTPLDLAWRQVAIDEKEGRLPDFVAETETEKKLERIAERNRASRAELAKIRQLLAGDSQAVDEGLEAVGRYAATRGPSSSTGGGSNSASSLGGERSGIRASRPEIAGAMKDILNKKRKALKHKKLTKKVRKRLKIGKEEKAALKQMLKQIGEESDDFHVVGKVISLK